MALYNSIAKYCMQVHLQIETADFKNMIEFKPILGSDIPNIMAKAYIQGILYKTKDGDLQLICPLWIKTIFFIPIKQE
jgi:hypothetical protein